MSRRRKASPVPPAADSGLSSQTERQVLAELWALIVENRRVLFLFFALAMLTRFFQLGEASLWMDEIALYREAYSGTYDLVSYRAHRAHLLPLHVLMQVVGQSELSVRLYSALLGALMVPVLSAWALFAGGRRYAIVYTSLLVCNTFLVMYAQDAAYYSGMVFYAAIQLLGLQLLFRRAWLSGVLLFIVGSIVGYFNHPISLLPTLGMIAGSAVGVLASRDLRGFLLPKKSTPALPLAMFSGFLLLGLAGFFLLSRIQPMLELLVVPGQTTLLNVEFSFAFLARHWADFTVNFHRPAAIDLYMSLVPFLLFAGGLLAFFRPGRNGVYPYLWIPVILSVLVPIVCYTILFSINVQRYFYIRYFITLIVLIHVPIAYAITELWRAGNKTLAVATCLIPGWFLVTYYWNDLSNHRAGIAWLAEHRKPGEHQLATSSNDRVEDFFYLEKFGQPYAAPGYEYLNRLYDLDLYATSLPTLMRAEPTWLSSSWRYMPAPRLWALVNSLEPEFRGTSKWEEAHDFILIRWDDKMARANRLHGSPLGSGASEFVTPPRHSRVFIEGDETAILRIERDDSVDYLVRQPEEPGLLRVLVSAPDPDDPVLKKNSTPVPPGMLVAVAVDGEHRGFWSVDSSGGRGQWLTLDVGLPPGDHRITITGLQPRRVYTPYFPWSLGGVLLATPADVDPPAMSLEQSAAIALSPGWTRIPETGSTADGPAPDWQLVGPYELGIDSNIAGPAGDPALVLSCPPASSDPSLLLGPTMPVNPDTLAVYWFYLRYEGLTEHEITPVYIAVDSSGNALGGPMPVNGPNYRGTSHGVWYRVLVAVPVPDGTAYIAPGIQTYPIKGADPTSGGRIWLASFASPGVADIQFFDPLIATQSSDKVDDPHAP